MRRLNPGFLVTVAVAAMALALSACSAILHDAMQGSRQPALTPEQAILRSIPSSARDVRILVSSPAPDGATALVYSYSILEQVGERTQKYNVLGFGTADLNEQGSWSLTSSRSTGIPSPNTFDVYPSHDIYQSGYTAVYGLVQEEQAAQVQVTFSSGETVSQAVDGGYFLVFSVEPLDVCALSYLDARGNLIERDELNRDFEESDTCPVLP